MSKRRKKYKKEHDENKEFMGRMQPKNWNYIVKKIKQRRGWSD